ncbi:hypothetical protein BT63DRAFT_454569 [Microthyrium microscopicum]|uniref:Zn(2)-C6 fungal-type domain-containing protein n=1 Tax=Microthyrium microscopicum TaxID=703497 RepID=A0A6A6UDJ9_9PEZI|nr:hypothetical protein BT63DRAFT_454569 [Microthyrium microscopicum]
MTSDAEDGASPEPEIVDQEAEAGDEDMAESILKDSARKTESNASSDTPNGQTKSNAKDPSRPRRKKARRACFACQRAHLTCGDERPCQRCIKRGLQDACQDGIRKKAKYLHDAPAEALIPPQMGGTYNLHGTQTSSSQPNNSLMQSSAAMQPIYYQEAPQISVDMYGQPTSQSHMHQQMAPSSAGASYGPHTPISPQYPHPHSTPQQQPQIQTPQPHVQHTPPIQSYPFDPSDPAFFNFDISNLNFGNSYGALEFSMIGHMASGANELQSSQPDIMTPVGQQIPHPSYPTPTAEQQSLLFGQEAMMKMDWNSQRHPAPSSNGPLETPHNTPIMQSADRVEASNGPSAYAIGARPNSLASASPVSLSQDTPGESTGSPSLFTPSTGQSASSSYARQSILHHPVQHPHNQSAELHSHSHGTTLNPARKRAHDGDYIYDQVKHPYPYTAGFHRLLNYIKTHFNKNHTERIAQALAAIRPALITFAQQLTEKDLIFMEIGVQRKLFAYDDFIKAYGTPTVITRRDGAIVAVSQEFVILTGWSKDVLLGKKPNLNANHVGTSSTGASTTGSNSARGTRRPSAEPDSNGNGNMNQGSTSQHTNSAPGLPKNVFIAEIMAQESVVEFYEDFAKLAFGDAMGMALRRGKLLKYKTQADLDAAEAAADGKPSKHDGGSVKPEPSDASSIANSSIAGEGDFVRLGEKEGVVDCMYCWNVRRDNFEVPQLIVMNFLPVINP